MAALFISHGMSYITNFLGRREFVERTVREQLFAPHGRIVVMHSTIILGGWLAMLVGAPVGALVVMVMAKIVLDILVHLKEHGALSAGR